MKLSEMSLDQARNCMVELTDSLGAIAQDEEVLAYFDETRKGNSIVDLINLVGKLLRDHYANLVTVLSALTGESAKAIREKSAGEVIALAKDVYDQDLKRFFTH